jgi:hypothetical protein
MSKLNQLKDEARVLEKQRKVRHPVIDNSKYPSTEEVARLFRVPAYRVRQLKDLAKKISTAESVR